MALNKESTDTISKKISGFLKRNNTKETKQVLPQDKETPVCTVNNKKFTFRYGYARAHESMLLGDKGQDYLNITNQGNKFVFTLCDGVSQSFYGDIAAQYLGDTLTKWFNLYLSSGMDSAPIQLALNTMLAEATVNGTALVNKHPLAADIPEMLRAVLEDKRNIGSETTFVTCRIDLPCSEYPEGRAVFAWLGDSRLRIWNDREEITHELNGEFKTMQRWSSKRGSLGSMVHVHVQTLSHSTGIRRVLAYTDGLSCLDEQTQILGTKTLQSYIDQTGQMPTSDDIAIIELLLPPWNNHISI